MKKNTRRTNIDLSMHFEFVYGNRTYREIKDWHSVTYFKKYINKLLDTYKVVIDATVSNSDNLHKTEMLKLIDKEKNYLKSSRDFHELDQTMITFQSELIFRLIGNMPNNENKKNVTNNKRNWQLNDYRRIIYLQDNKQKVNVIFSLVKKENYKDKLPDLSDLRDKFIDFSSDSDKFIDWFKRNYPEVYLELF